MTESNKHGLSVPSDTEAAAQAGHNGAEHDTATPLQPKGTEAEQKQEVCTIVAMNVPSNGLKHKSVAMNLQNSAAGQTAAELVARTATLGSRWNWVNWTYVFPSGCLHVCLGSLVVSSVLCTICSLVATYDACSAQMLGI